MNIDDLTPYQRKLYYLKKEQWPDWSHEQIIISLQFDETIGKVVNDGGENVNIEDPTVILPIFENVGNWTKNNFPDFYEKIEPTFREISIRLSQMIQNGIKAIGNFIERVLNFFN